MTIVTHINFKVFARKSILTLLYCSEKKQRRTNLSRQEWYEHPMTHWKSADDWNHEIPEP